MKDEKRKILKKFSYETDGSVCKDKKEYNEKLNQALTALENLEKEVKVEELEQTIDSLLVLLATNISNSADAVKVRRFIDMARKDIIQSLKSKYKITKREE